MDEATMLKKRGYTIGKHLGEGSYAKVRSAYSEHHKFNVAIKVIDRKKSPADFLEKFLPREIEISKIMKHHSVVKIYEIFETADGKVYIIMELAVHGDLLDFIKEKGPLSEELACRMFRQLVSAVKYCHDLDIVHRDLKCENLLLDKDFNIKLSDFGFARHLARNSSGKIILSKTFCGSPAYAAPEILQGIPYQPKVYDIWSLGVTLYIMVCGVMPYDDSNIKRMLRLQKEHRLEFPRSKHISSKCKELIYGMLQPDVTLRLTADQILNHGWLQLTQKPKEQKPNIKKAVTAGIHTNVMEENNLDKVLCKSEDEEPVVKEKHLQQKIASTALDMEVEDDIVKTNPEHSQKTTM